MEYGGSAYQPGTNGPVVDYPDQTSSVGIGYPAVSVLL